MTIVKIPETTKAVQVDNKRKRDEQEIPAVKKAVVDNAIKPRFTQQFSRKISAQIAPNTQNLLKPKNVDPAVEKLAASSALPRDQVYQLYDENKDLTVKEFLELLTLKTVEQMDKAFLKELQSLES